MNGSPAKLGTISGTAGHTSALKDAQDLAHLSETEHDADGNHLGKTKNDDDSAAKQKELPKGSKSESYKTSKSKSMNKEFTGKKSEAFEYYDSQIQFIREDLFQEKISKADADKKINELEKLRDTFKQ